MNSLAAVICFGAICFGDVFGSYYHGPTAVPHVLHDGYLADTHEEAAAKSANLATIFSQSHGHHDLSYHGNHGDSRYHGPIAVPHVLHNGHIADTHEVAAAKAEHFAAVAKARTHHHDYNGQYAAGFDNYSGVSGAYQGHGAQGGYHGPIAILYVLHDGHIADTHEVAATKAEHFAAVAKARTHHHDYYGQYAVGYDHSSGSSGAYHEYGAHVGYPHYSEVSGAYHVYGAHGRYHGPLAKPVVLPSGYLADTLEVAAIKHKHEIAHANLHHRHSNNSRQHYVH